MGEGGRQAGRGLFLHPHCLDPSEACHDVDEFGGHAPEIEIFKAEIDFGLGMGLAPELFERCGPLNTLHPPLKTGTQPAQ